MTTRFTERMLAGEAPTNEEWREHLIAYHERYAGVTAPMLAPFSMKSERETYERLADSIEDAVQPSTQILDIGCGDGLLLELLRERWRGAKLSGIDMSASDLALARARFPAMPVELILGDATVLPYADGIVDIVVSHLAFALVPQIGIMMEEVRRILRPGGLFAFVVENPRAGGKAIQRVNAAAIAAIIERHPKFAPVYMGDPRLFDTLGVETILAEAGFAAKPSFCEFSVESESTFSDIWLFVRRTYMFGMLDHADLDFAKSRAAESVGTESLTALLPLRLVAVQG